jgi:hypothetical protein
VDGALFMANKYVFDVMANHLIIYVHDGAARVTENGVHIFLFQYLEKHLRSC